MLDNIIIAMIIVVIIAATAVAFWFEYGGRDASQSKDEDVPGQGKKE